MNIDYKNNVYILSYIQLYQLYIKYIILVINLKRAEPLENNPNIMSTHSVQNIITF